MEVLEVNLFSPSQNVGHFKAKNIIVPGVWGYVGIYYNHASLISELKPGTIQVEDENGQTHFFFISKGYVEVCKNKATIFSDDFETQASIDVKRVESAEQRAQERLQKRGDEEISIPRALAALERAKARRALLELQKKSS